MCSQVRYPLLAFSEDCASVSRAYHNYTPVLGGVAPVMAEGSPTHHRPRRRNAVKHGKVVEIKGHKFVLTYFKQFTFCGHCTRFLW